MPGVAHEPLVGLDRHRAVGVVVLVARAAAREMRSRVAAVAQLAEELVDEVAAVGEDQDAAGARRLDEAQRGDRLAGARRVLEPEALGGVGVLGRLGVLASSGVARRLVPVLRLLVGLLVLEALGQSSSPGIADEAERRRARRPRGAVPLPLRWASASSAVSVPDSASTWWAESTVPSTSLRLVLGEQALEPEQQRRSAGATRPTGTSRAGVELGERGVERAPRGRVRARARPSTVLALEHEGLAGERLCALDVARESEGTRPDRPLRGFSHEGSESDVEGAADAAQRPPRTRGLGSDEAWPASRDLRVFGLPRADPH